MGLWIYWERSSRERQQDPKHYHLYLVLAHSSFIIFLEEKSLLPEQEWNKD